MIEQVSCEQASIAIKAIAGWLFAHFINHLIGDGTLVLKGEGKNGEDIKFAPTHAWLERNHVSRLGVTPELGQVLSKHIRICDHPGCVIARDRLDSVPALFKKDTPGMSSFFITATVMKTGFPLIRKDGFGDSIDELKPFFEWFTEERDFWVWESEEKEATKQ